MDRFSKDAVFDELRTIFLFEADHIALGAGPAMAEQFIGFATDEGEYCHMAPSLVDLDRFAIKGSFDRGYDYAFRPSLTNTLDESEVQDLIAFMVGTPRIGGVSSAGEVHRFMTPEGFCQTVADTVHARWKLEWNGSASESFTTRELALLANMTEGAVRNAMSDRSENGLKAIPGSKPIRVEYDEAKRWLANRRGFVAMPRRPREDAVLNEIVGTARTAKDLGVAIQKRNSFLGSKEPHSDLLSAGFSLEEIQAWENGTFRFDTQKALSLAEVLDFDVPLFVGKALEVSLRRGETMTNGGHA